MGENWVKWDIGLSDFPNKIYLESLTDSKEGLILVFSNEDSDKIYKFNFEYSVLSYRNNDESYMLRTLSYISETCGKEVLGNPLFTVERSSYIEWFNNQSFDIYKDYNPTHYAFFTPNDIVEVISNYPPTVYVN
ncbi:hypothetical protein [Paenibacillus apiarius]|uniref:hypothetical protein n=1 Tax=Paenibacillus apiarius TaxID=46240 RepID=UPI003B3AD101